MKYILSAGLASLFIATPVFAGEEDILNVRLAAASLTYVPSIPSQVPNEWEPWEKSATDLIYTIAGASRKRAAPADIWYESKRAGLDLNTVFVLVEVLSRFDPGHLSASGQIGLLQITPVAHEKIGNPENSLYQPKYNLRLGCALLRMHLDYSDGDVIKALTRFFTYASPQDSPKSRIEEFTRLLSARSIQLNRNKPNLSATEK